MEELQECPACTGTLFTSYLTCQDQLVSQKQFAIQQCDQCQLFFTNPRPTVETIGSYYKSDTYISHDDTKKGVIDTIYRTVRSYALSQKESWIRSMNGGVGALLDYGCGTGAFIKECQEKGWAITGFEPDPDARRLAGERVSQKILKDNDEIKSLAQLDVITLWHVLEHVADLKQTLSMLTEKLKTGGHLVIAVPNPASKDAAMYGPNWAAYDVPRHLYHFTPTVLTALIETYGLKLQKRLPMRFDAYYIAMLSTKHRDGKINYLESVMNGMRSNNAASKTGNYSSLTYVFRKL
ncbi:class I SAM-dependent methyltransferase [Fibrella forsythiae]|uniref:Class I SAM-dependent methyltransferase n=1 Tax=Fibrella forsythiae TaxID=2817061 RepID=A0ABS3JJL1_9BACT|nr:class I SAM-dependent methyltransferase [Fibrella forsythiae]MBO0950200.1 class I SAM-dependent methyltransferase [Fibrella forsythiae]